MKIWVKLKTFTVKTFRENFNLYQWVRRARQNISLGAMQLAAPIIELCYFCATKIIETF